MLEEGRRSRRLFVLLVAAEVAAVGALHRLGGVDGFAIPRHDLGRWIRQTPSEDVLLAGLRLAALVAAWWLLGTTLLYVGARIARLHGTAHALGWATLPAVRRWADRAAAVSIVAAGALGAVRPAGADPPPATTTPAPVVVDVDHRDRAALPDLPPSTREPLAQPSGTLPSATVPPVVPVVPVVPVMPTSGPPAPDPEATHTVRAGEHLWSIAAATVAARTGRSVEAVSPSEVAPYWRRVVERNRDRLRSGNPSLVYPGEVLELPPA